LAQVIGSQKRHSEVSMGASDNDSAEVSESTYCLNEKLAKTDFLAAKPSKNTQTTYFVGLTSGA
jgi:hypothetical protein